MRARVRVRGRARAIGLALHHAGLDEVEQIAHVLAALHLDGSYAQERCIHSLDAIANPQARSLGDPSRLDAAYLDRSRVRIRG